MDSAKPVRNPGGFALIELLLVIAIIATRDYNEWVK
jgi:prepilin-type N-terminal cleavage/methylation domain-containing protein